MRSLSLTVLLAAVLLVPNLRGQTCSGPGKERWPIKTSVVEGAKLDKGQTIGLDKLLALADPPGMHPNDPKFQSNRIPDFPNDLKVKEGDILSTTGWLYLIATEKDDCDYHIQISTVSRTTTNKPQPDDNALIVEAPKPDFVSDQALREHVQTARDYIKTKLLRGQEPANVGSVMIHAVCVSVTGQLFYDDAHLEKNGQKEVRGKRGMESKTLWELHPITGFTIVQPNACPS